MDREVIEQKLESLRRCLQRVAQKCPSDPATLGRDLDLHDIVTLNLTRVVQLWWTLTRTSLPTWMCCHQIRWAKPSMRWPTPVPSPSLWPNN